MQVATSSGGAYGVEAGGAETSADQSALAIDSNGQVFLASLSGGEIETEIRAAGGAWATPDTRSSGGTPAAPSLAADGAGDVAALWTSSTGIRLNAFDAVNPTLTITPPSNLTPGTKTWSVSINDVWSEAGASTPHWVITPSGHQYDGLSFSEMENPGPITATVTATDGAGNPGTATATVTISSVGPTGGNSVDLGRVRPGPGPDADGGATARGAGTRPRACPSSGSAAPPRASRSAAPPGTTYTLTTADVGTRILVEETASNSGGSAVDDSDETPVVAPISTGTVNSLTPDRVARSPTASR